MATYLHSPDAAARIDFDGFSIILHVEQRAIISSSECADCVISATPRVAVNAYCLADYTQTQCVRVPSVLFLSLAVQPTSHTSQQTSWSSPRSGSSSGSSCEWVD